MVPRIVAVRAVCIALAKKNRSTSTIAVLGRFWPLETPKAQIQSASKFIKFFFLRRCRGTTEIFGVPKIISPASPPPRYNETAVFIDTKTCFRLPPKNKCFTLYFLLGFRRTSDVFRWRFLCEPQRCIACGFDLTALRRCSLLASNVH